MNRRSNTHIKTSYNDSTKLAYYRSNDDGNLLKRIHEADCVYMMNPSTKRRFYYKRYKEVVLISPDLAESSVQLKSPEARRMIKAQVKKELRACLATRTYRSISTLQQTGTSTLFSVFQGLRLGNGQSDASGIQLELQSISLRWTWQLPGVGFPNTIENATCRLVVVQTLKTISIADVTSIVGTPKVPFWQMPANLNGSALSEINYLRRKDFKTLVDQQIVLRTRENQSNAYDATRKLLRPLRLRAMPTTAPNIASGDIWVFALSNGANATMQMVFETTYYCK